MRPARKNSDFLPGLFLLLAALAVFSPLLGAEFSNWDDPQNVVSRPELIAPGWSFLPWSFGNFLVGDFKPLAWWSYAWDYRFWGLNPAGYHLGNILLHGLNTLLAYFFLRRASLSAGEGGGRGAAALGAFLWGLHPLRVESVAWISDRKGLLCGFCSLFSLLAWLRFRREGRDSWSVVSVLSGILALLAKPVAVVLVVLIPLTEFFRPPGERIAARRACLRLAPLALAAAASAAAAFWGQAVSGSLVSPARFGVEARIESGLGGLLFYPLKTLLPFSLSAAYPSPPLRVWEAFGAGTLVLLAAALGRRRWRGGKRAAGVWFFFYLAGIFPLAGFFPAGLVTAADRFVYLPALGFSGLACVLLGRLRSRAVPALALIALSLAALSFTRCRETWRSPLQLWRASVRASPASAPARAHYGQVLFEAGQLGPAAGELEEALRLLPPAPLAHTQVRTAILSNLAQALQRLGRYAEAEARARELVALDGRWLFRHLLGSILQGRGRREEALEQYGLALTGNPGWIPSLCEAGLLRAGEGDLPGALEHYRRALEFDPASPRARYYLALALLDGGETEKGREILSRLWREFPSSRWLARALLALERGVGAAAAFPVPESPDLPYRSGPGAPPESHFRPE